MDVSNFRWQLTGEMRKKIEEIETLKRVFDKLPLPESVLQIVRKRALINSAVSSAQIENIPSTVQSPRKEGKNLEVAYHQIYSSSITSRLSVTLIKNFHKQALAGLSGSAGQFRAEAWGIYDRAGNLVDHTPLHTLVPKLVEELVSYLGKLQDHPVIIAAVGQLIFEKIHPFADGNGRTGRLISAYLLQVRGYGFRGLVSLENHINRHRDTYYSTFRRNYDCSDFVNFFLDALITGANKTLEDLQNPPTDTPENKLLPRRRELLEVIKDHPECSFNFLHRRFMDVNQLALHRDLKHLQEIGLVTKLGSTRGAVYVARADIP